MMRPGMWGLTGLCLGLVAVLAVELAPSAPGPGLSPPSAVTPVRAKAVTVPDAPTADWIETALARPLLSPTRRPAPANSGPVQEGGDGLRLSGIMIGPSGRRAMFVAGQGGKSVEVEEGGTVLAYRVERIDAGGVMVSGSDGTRELRLSFADRAAALPAAAPSTGGANAVSPAASDLPPGILPMDLAPAAPVRPRP